MSHTTEQGAAKLKDDAKRHQHIQDEHDKGAGAAGGGNAVGYPSDDRQNTEMACGGSPVTRSGKPKQPTSSKTG